MEKFVNVVHYFFNTIKSCPGLQIIEPSIFYEKITTFTMKDMKELKKKLHVLHELHGD